MTLMRPMVFRINVAKDKKINIKNEQKSLSTQSASKKTEKYENKHLIV